jgi:threonine dehydrogenase-like Zn-dependent dehydrogenase
MTQQMNTVDYKLGQMDTAIKSLVASNERIEAAMAEMRVDIETIKTTQAERRGERRVAVWAAGGIGSFAMLLLSAIGRKLGFIS